MKMSRKRKALLSRVYAEGMNEVTVEEKLERTSERAARLRVCQMGGPSSYIATGLFQRV